MVMDKTKCYTCVGYRYYKSSKRHHTVCRIWNCLLEDLPIPECVYYHSSEKVNRSLNISNLRPTEKKTYDAIKKAGCTGILMLSLKNLVGCIGRLKQLGLVEVFVVQMKSYTITSVKETYAYKSFKAVKVIDND